VAGDLGAISKVEELITGDVLHDDHALDAAHLQPERYPAPLFGLAITAKSRNDEQKLAKLLHKLGEEDPTLRIQQDSNTNELVIQGLGEIHLRLVLERMKNRGVDVNVHPPKIAYRETITAPSQGHYRHKKQTGGAGQFADVSLRIEPLDRGNGFEFIDDIFGGAIPKPFVAAVEKGVHDELIRGALAGYPIQDVRVTVTDGKTHPVDSKEIAFRTAGRFAFRDAFLKAAPVILEPIVEIEVTVPSEKVGSITGDIAQRRGRIVGTDLRPGGMSVVRGQVPLAEIPQFQSHLKGLTGGQGTFVMDFSHYDPAPSNVQRELAAAWKPVTEEA
jgi:elongation factor G